MKSLVISKPVYDYILPLAEFPKDGDKFYIDKAINSLSNYGSIVALTFGKYGEDVEFTGVVGEDEVGKKIKEIFANYQVKTKYIETCYTEKSMISYKIYNIKNNKFTSVNEISSKTGLLKYKYEFIPEVIIMDDKDYNANLAAINNFPSSLLIYVADKYTKESSVYLNKCKYVICDLKFVCNACGVSDNINKQKGLVMLFQKFIDLYSTNLIIKLDNFDMLYCLNDEVRLIKNINKNLNNKESIYYSLIIYYLTKDYNIEESIKLTNKTLLECKNEIDIIQNIPDYEIVNKVINDYEEYKKIHNINSKEVNATSITNNSQIIQNNNISNNNSNNNQNQIFNNQNVNNINQTIEKVEQVALHNPNENNIEKLDIEINNQNNNGVNNGE